MSISTLQPTKIWQFFDDICKIPHPSKKEDRMIDYLMKFGQDRQLETLKDEAGKYRPDVFLDLDYWALVPL